MEVLTHLFRDKQLAPGMVPGYPAAFASAFKHVGIPDVDHNPALTALLSGSFSREHPRRPRVLPQWDLALVLMALTLKTSLIGSPQVFCLESLLSHPPRLWGQKE